MGRALAQGVTVRRSLLISIGDANIDLYRDTAAVVSDTRETVTLLAVISGTAATIE